MVSADSSDYLPILNASCETVLIAAAYCQHLFYNSSQDLMEDCFLKLCFAPQIMKSNQLYPLTVVYLSILVIGVMGNLSTCVVMYRADKRAPSSTSRYLGNLAAADLITLLSGVPFEIYLGWNQYPWHPPDFLCHAKAWILETTSYVSVLTIVAFSLERYVAICHSLSANSLLIGYRRRISGLLLGIWVIGGICASPYGFYHRVDYMLGSWPTDEEYGPIRKSKMCMLALVFDPSLRANVDVLFHASAIVFFFIPLLSLIFLYFRMGLVVRRSYRDMHGFRRSNNNNNSPPPHHPLNHLSFSMNVALTVIENSTMLPNGNTTTVGGGGGGGGVASERSSSTSRITRPYSRKTFYMLAAVVVAFFFCYAPYQIHRLLLFYDDDDSQQQTVNAYFYIVSGVMFYLSSVVNPILYSVLSMRFRSAFTKLLCLWKWRRANVASRIPYCNIPRVDPQLQQNQAYGLVLLQTRKLRTPSPTSLHLRLN